MTLQIDLSGRTALVTGASRGIGRAAALALAAAGAEVVTLARTEDALEDLRREIESTGGVCHAVPADLTDGEALDGMVADLWSRHDGIDVLVNTAGMIIRAEPPEVTPDQFDQVFDLNVRATFFLTQAVGSRMFERGAGSVVTVASVAAEVVTRAPVIYQASKAALVQMTRGLAVRWGPHVRVNAVGPGYVATELTEKWLSDPDNRGWVESHTALARVGEVEDIAGVVAFLASPLASYITGQHLIVDGGWSNP